MQHIYMHNHEHLQVFTTVLAPQGRCRYRAEAEKMVVVHSYRPHWPDELALCAGDVILVLSKHEEERWFGRRRDGLMGYFPASCVMELSQTNLSPEDLHRTFSLRSSAWDNDSGIRNRNRNGHDLQGLRRGSSSSSSSSSRGAPGGGEAGSAPVAPQPQSHRSPSLLHRILSKCRRRSECQGATNGAFEGD